MSEIIKPEHATVDTVDTWINKDSSIDYQHIKYGVLGVDWSGSFGFGRWEMILDSEGIPHIYTEHMDKQDDKSFSKAILEKVLDIAIIEE